MALARVTFANVLLGHPKYTVTGGDALIKGESIMKLATDEKRRKASFLASSILSKSQGLDIATF